MMNTFGNIYRLTGFGESHGAAIGGVIDGMPAGVTIDEAAVQHQLDRRRPGQSDITTARGETDKVELLSGIFEGKTLGTPIGFIIRNADSRPADYYNMREVFRPSHADYTYSVKYGGHRDHRGGGRSSARETAARVVCGALARQALERQGIEIFAYTSRVGPVEVPVPYTELDLRTVDENIVRCPHAATAGHMIRLIREIKSAGDTVGGIITGVIKGVPAGLGEPVGGKLHAMLGAAMLSINAVKGFEYGMGFDGACRTGSETMDGFYRGKDSKIHTTANHSGGIQGGISNGEDIYFRVAFKPVATLLRRIETIDIDGKPVTLDARGRHDPCVLPRAVPVVEAMAAMVVMDSMLMNRCATI